MTVFNLSCCKQYSSQRLKWKQIHKHLIRRRIYCLCIHTQIHFMIFNPCVAEWTAEMREKKPPVTFSLCPSGTEVVLLEVVLLAMVLLAMVLLAVVLLAVVLLDVNGRQVLNLTALFILWCCFLPLAQNTDSETVPNSTLEDGPGDGFTILSAKSLFLGQKVICGVPRWPGNNSCQQSFSFGGKMTVGVRKIGQNLIKSNEVKWLTWFKK